MMNHLNYLFASLLICLAGLPAQAGSIAYRVSPELKSGQLTAVAVEIRFPADQPEVTKLHLPDEFAGQSELWRQVVDFTVEGATVTTPSPALRTLQRQAGASLVVRYRVISAYATDPKGQDGLPNRALVLSNWFGLLGEVVFAVPEGTGHEPVTFSWGEKPAGWVMVSDLDHARPLEVESLQESFLYGSNDLRLTTLDEKKTFRLALRGQWKFTDTELGDMLRQLDATERQFWQDSTSEYFVPLVPLTPLPKGTLHAGIGRGDAFALYSTTDSTLKGFQWVLAHERLHTWIPLELGGLPEKDEALEYWFSEGFTDYYTARALLKSGIWSVDDFIAEQNQMLKRYAESPNPLPNTRILKEFWTDRVVRQVAYDRGRLLATIWDHRLASLPQKTTLGRILRNQRVEAMKNQQTKHILTAAKVFPGRYHEAGGADLKEELERFVEQGQQLKLPEDLYGDFARISTVSVEGKPAFQKVTAAPGLTREAFAKCLRLDEE